MTSRINFHLPACCLGMCLVSQLHLSYNPSCCSSLCSSQKTTTLCEQQHDNRTPPPLAAQPTAQTAAVVVTMPQVIVNTFTKYPMLTINALIDGLSIMYHPDLSVDPLPSEQFCWTPRLTSVCLGNDTHQPNGRTQVLNRRKKGDPNVVH